MTYKLYSVLGLNKQDDPDKNEVKKAYKRMAMEYHPDKNKDNPEAVEKFKEISHAHDVLTDDEKKRIYDQVGDEGFERNGGNAPQDPFSGFSRGPMHHADIFDHFFRGGHNPFSSHFGFDFGEGGGNTSNPSQCASVHKQVNISLEEAFEGVNKTMIITIVKYCHTCMTKCVNCNGAGVVKQIRHMGILTQISQGRCDRCSGAGYMIDAKKSCSECNGSGKYTKEVNAHLTLPKGVHHGLKTAFPDMGEQPKNPNQKAGDLILEIVINSHPLFKRVDNDLYYKCDLTYIESVIGKEITIPYFKENIKINTNKFGVVHPKKTYILEGKGMPVLDSNSMGNMIIEFNINYPKIKNKDKIKELEKLLKETFF